MPTGLFSILKSFHASILRSEWRSVPAERLIHPAMSTTLINPLYSPGYAIATNHNLRRIVLRISKRGLWPVCQSYGEFAWIHKSSIIAHIAISCHLEAVGGNQRSG